MGSERNWTRAEIDYLKDKWGVISLKAISDHLNRSEQGVVQKCQSLKLGAARDHHPQYITLNYLLTALYGNHHTNGNSYARQHLCDRLGIKIYMVPQPQIRRKCIDLEEFWKAAE